MAQLIIKGKYLLPMAEAMETIKDGIIVVEGQNIIDIGSEDLIKKYLTGEVLDTGNSIIMPGLINTHTHAAMAYFRGLADDLPLKQWLEEHIWPAEAKHVNPLFVKKSSELAVLEMIKSGTTCFNDMYFFEGETAEVAIKAGVRSILGETSLVFSSPSCKTPADTIIKIKSLLKKYKDNELVQISLAPHAIYTCTKDILNEISVLSKENNLLIHIHVSETKKEVEDCLKEHGKTPVEYLDEVGFLSDKVIAAHSVWLNDNDLEIFKKRKVKVSHCPMSNKKLASGIAPVAKMLEKGITVSIGTDGVASNNTMDMFSDMHTSALLHKVSHLDPTVLPAKEVVKMATINAAKALDLDHKIGSLEIGRRADMITINLDKPHLQPIYDPYSHLVYCVNGGDVENVIVNGRLLMRERRVLTMDEERILNEAKDFRIK